jgi:LmbE family N-acetylglucosaminyl deacetylase
MVGAHPDDEDSALLADLVLRHGVRTAYLSLTRGEGGQNCLGPESGAALGVLRTGELLASRRYDGAEQLFSPCVDFGYAKRAEDAFAHWPRERVVGSIVQAIRALQPDVVVSIWTGTRIDGHGHHQACGAATREAFDLAGEMAAFPEQMRAGLSPWRPKRLLVRVRDTAHQAADDLHVNVGRFDPALGRSCFEVAMQGRSLHRSQNMGALLLKGAQHVVYRVAAGPPAAGGQDANPLDGLPVRLDAWARTSFGRQALNRPDVVAAIASTVQHLDAAWQNYHPQRPERTAPILAAALGVLRNTLQMLDGEPPALHGRLQECQRRVEAAWLQAHGLALDVLTAKPEVVAGGSVDVEAELFLRGNIDAILSSLETHAQPGWRVECLAGPSLPVKVRGGGSLTARFRLTAPHNETTAVASTLAPWLRLPPEGDLYHFEQALPCLEPSALPSLTVQATLRAGDAEPEPVRGSGQALDVPLSVPVAWRELDPARGELRHPLRVRPTVTINVSPSLIVMPASAAVTPTVDVQLHAHAAGRGRLVLRACDGDPPEVHVSAALNLQAGEQRTVRQTLLIGSDVSGKRAFEMEWRDETAPAASAKAASRLGSWQDVRYPHVEPGYVLAPAEVCVSVVPVEVAPGLRVGYLPGTGDGVAEALNALGVSVQTIEEDDLQNGALAGFDTVVVGVRAFETRPSLAAHRGRLWNYARAGGTVVVQYHKPRDDGPGRFVPFDGVSLPRPAPRVSQAAAPVSLLVAADPILSFPNRLDADDFSGWQQERGLYFLAEWPPQMTPLLESADPGEPPRRGGLLHARLGRGHYVYCAYALFRQLPAGVPGAYRLLANLVSIARAPGA